jgi:transposase
LFGDRLQMAMRGRPWRRPTRDTGRTSRPGFVNRQIVNGILWRIRTGAPWHDLSAKYGKWMVVCQRFRRKSEGRYLGSDRHDQRQT